MANSSHPNLPPLHELLAQIDFPVFGLATPYLGLQLRSLHYGVEEEGKSIIGLGLFYAQKYLGSPQVMAVESSVLPEKLAQGDTEARIEWSWSNLVSLRDALFRLHSTEPAELLDDEVIDRRFQESVETMRTTQWARLTGKSAYPLLVGMEVSRGQGGEIMARRIDGNHMLLVISLGIEPEAFLQGMKELTRLQEAAQTIQRHQDEFERITAG